MRMQRLLPAGLAAVALMVAGCNNSPTGGHAATDDSFKLKAPAVSTVLKRGDRETVTVTLDRGPAFKQYVRMEAQSSKGLKVSLANTRVNTDDKADVAVTVEADAAAPLGDHVVKIVATPDTGVATSVDFKVQVRER